MKPSEISENAVYLAKALTTSRPARRVIRIIGDAVFYSSGGNQNHSCQLKTFARAVKGKFEIAGAQ